MKTMRPLLLTALIISSCSLFAQETDQKTIAIFKLLNGTVDGIDVTKDLLDNDAHTIFYIPTGDSVLYLSNSFYKADSQSFGPVEYTLEMVPDVTLEGYRTETYYCDWKYVNSYDAEEGIAKVKFILTYMPDKLLLSIMIVPSDMEIIIYNGELEEDTHLPFN